MLQHVGFGHADRLCSKRGSVSSEHFPACEGVPSDGTQSSGRAHEIPLRLAEVQNHLLGMVAWSSSGSHQLGMVRSRFGGPLSGLGSRSPSEGNVSFCAGGGLKALPAEPACDRLPLFLYLLKNLLSASRRRRRALCNWDFEVPGAQPIMAATSLCS